MHAIRFLGATVLAAAMASAQAPCWETSFGTFLGLGDDAYAPAQPLGFTFTYAGVGYTDIVICSNGYIWLGQTAPGGLAPDYSPSAAELVSQGPRIAPLWMDFNPSEPGSGNVWFNSFPASGGNPARAVITWDNVFEYNGTTPLSMQCTLLDGGPSGGSLIFHYDANMAVVNGGFGLDPHVVGASNGAGSANAVNFSATPIVTAGNPTLHQTIARGAFPLVGRDLHFLADGAGGFVVTERTSCNAPLATAANYGAGCYDRSTTYYENFAAGTFDLAGSVGVTNSFLMAPNGSGGYVLAPGSNSWFTPVSASLGLSDDSVSGPQNLPFNLSHPGGTTNVLRVGSNGMVFPTSNTSLDFSPTVAELLSGVQRWCPAWRDLNPGVGGSVHFDIAPSNTAAYVTWVNVPNFGGTTPNNIQVALFNTGVVEYRYQDMDVAGATIAGYTTGNGAPDPGNIDLSVQIPLGYSTGPGGASLALNASARPLAGTTVQMRLSNVPGTNLGVVLLSFNRLSPSLELSGLGMANCFQHIVTAGAATLGIVFGNGSANLPIPGGTFYLGTDVYLQGAAFVPGVNLLGVVSSNGVQLRVGNI